MSMSSHQAGLEDYLRPTRFIDSDDPSVREFAGTATEHQATDVDRAVALYHAVRDGVRYDPYRIDFGPDAMKASTVLHRKSGFCIQKAVLLAASARAVGIASRLGFADVKNHLTTERLRRSMRTDVFVFHGYTELLFAGKWVKATPAFNSALCERFNVAPLEFDGIRDSLFQQYDRNGNRYIEYVRDRGRFADLPLDEIRAAFEENYPSLMSGGTYRLPGSFEDEAPSTDSDNT